MNDAMTKSNGWTGEDEFGVTPAQRAAVAAGAPSHDMFGNRILRTADEADEILRNGRFDPR